MSARRAAPLAGWLERIGVEHPSGVKRGLAGVREVAARLGALPPAPSTVVVAGTNGKGSTVGFLEQLLLASGCRVGVTVSPHIHVFNERIRLCGRQAADEAIVAAFEAVDAARGDVQLSYFEWAILAALQAIKQARVDAAVLEVGLGGRLDAVNVVDADVAVVTNVGLDHQQYLGATRAEIGAEKVEVARPGKPLVIGEAQPPDSLLRRAGELDAPVYLAERDFGQRQGRLWLKTGAEARVFDYSCPRLHPVNAATALQAAALAGCALHERTVAEAAAAVRNPGRFEIVRRQGVTWVLDVAHNPQGAAFLAGQLRERFQGRRVVAVLGCLADKDAPGIVEALRGAVSEFAFADTGGERGQPGAALRDQVGQPSAFAGAFEDATMHLLRAVDAGDNGVMLACGAFDVVERARRHLDLHGAHSERPTLQRQ